MGIEEGLVRLIQADAGVVAIASVGGFLAELPKDQALPSWSYALLSEDRIYTHDDGPAALRPAIVEITCYGDAAVVVRLAAAIDQVLDGFCGALPEGTVVNGCFVLSRPGPDEYDGARRCWLRSLIYEIHYALSA